MDKNIMALRLTDGREFAALVKVVPQGVMVSTAISQFIADRKSLREVCEKLLTLMDENPHKDVGI